MDGLPLAKIQARRIYRVNQALSVNPYRARIYAPPKKRMNALWKTLYMRGLLMNLLLWLRWSMAQGQIGWF